MDQAPPSVQVNPQGTVNLPGEHERSNLVQLAAQSVAVLSALEIFGLIAPAVMLIAIVVMLVILVR